MKEEIRTKSKKAVDAITAEQSEEILKQGREEGQQAFLQRIAATSGTPPVECHVRLRTATCLRIFVRIDLFTNISNVSVNCITPAIVALVIAKLTLETDVSFSILALFQKDLQMIV